MEQADKGKFVFAIAISAMLILVGFLSYIYLADPHQAYSGNPVSANPAPDFTYTAVNGGVVSLSGLRGNIVVLDFMATWCQPCKDQIAYLKTINSEYSGQGVTVISMNVDLQVTNSELLMYRNDLGANWNFVTDTGGVSMDPQYSVTNIPTIIIINREGEVAKRNVGVMSVQNLRSAINPLL